MPVNAGPGRPAPDSTSVLCIENKALAACQLPEHLIRLTQFCFDIQVRFCLSNLHKGSVKVRNILCSSVGGHYLGS